MCPVEPPEGNGKLLRYRLDALEHRVKNIEVAAAIGEDARQRDHERLMLMDQVLTNLDAALRDLHAKHDQRARAEETRQKEQRKERKSDRRWMVGTGLTSAALVVAALGLFADKF